MIRDRLLLQVKDITLLERLLKIKDLTLEKTIEMFQEHEDKDYRHNPAAQSEFIYSSFSFSYLF